MIIGIAILAAAASFEIVGVALIRMGLEARALLIGCGALLLATYGVIVNLGTLDFSRLMGSYIAMFFVVSQLVSFVIFHEAPTLRTIIGGALIVGGGLTIIV